MLSPDSRAVVKNHNLLCLIRNRCARQTYMAIFAVQEQNSDSKATARFGVCTL